MAGDEDELIISITESTKQDLRRLGLTGEVAINGREVDVVPDGDAHEMVLVCQPGAASEYFDDDVVAACERCGGAIHHRPHIPPFAIKICMFCFLSERLAKGDDNPFADIAGR